MPAFRLISCLVASFIFLSQPSLAADRAESAADQIIADQIIVVRGSMDSSLTMDSDPEAFRKALKKVAVKAEADKNKANKNRSRIEAPSNSKTCDKGCDLCAGDCQKCPVEGCANCSQSDYEGTAPCCQGKLPNRLGMTGKQPLAQSNRQPTSRPAEFSKLDNEARDIPPPNWRSLNPPRNPTRLFQQPALQPSERASDLAKLRNGLGNPYPSNSGFANQNQPLPPSHQQQVNPYDNQLNALNSNLGGNYPLAIPSDNFSQGTANRVAVDRWNSASHNTQILPRKTRPLLESAFSLEQIAHRLEMQGLIDEADIVRKSAVELRRSARVESGE